MLTTMTSREFNQDTGRAKTASRKGLMIITDRGRPAHVLLGIEEYLRLSGETISIASLLAAPEGGEDDFEIPASRALPRVRDLRPAKALRCSDEVLSPAPRPWPEDRMPRGGVPCRRWDNRSSARPA